MQLILMTDRFGYQKEVEEIKNSWLEELLLFLGMDIQILNEKGSPSFIRYLFQNKVEIVNNLNDGSLRVSQDDNIVGIWDTPKLVLKKDMEKGGLYYEITLNYWSVSEENITT